MQLWSMHPTQRQKRGQPTLKIKKTLCSFSSSQFSSDRFPVFSDRVTFITSAVKRLKSAMRVQKTARRLKEFPEIFKWLRAPRRSLTLTFFVVPAQSIEILNLCSLEINYCRTQGAERFLKEHPGDLSMLSEKLVVWSWSKTFLSRPRTHTKL